MGCSNCRLQPVNEKQEAASRFTTPPAPRPQQVHAQSLSLPAQGTLIERRSPEGMEAQTPPDIHPDDLRASQPPGMVAVRHNSQLISPTSHERHTQQTGRVRRTGAGDKRRVSSRRPQD